MITDPRRTEPESHSVEPVDAQTVDAAEPVDDTQLVVPSRSRGGFWGQHLAILTELQFHFGNSWIFRRIFPVSYCFIPFRSVKETS
jgi:hypothetical protein